MTTNYQHLTEVAAILAAAYLRHKNKLFELSQNKSIGETYEREYSSTSAGLTNHGSGTIKSPVATTFPNQ